jgi:hypothetical protein
MNDIESKAIDVINEFFKNEDIPIDRIKAISLHWEDVDGYCLPVLNSEFYANNSVWKGTFRDG